ncbi:MAG: polysaccharide biosynthesis C-terminal domain-containing protein, partial [Dehalococcoidia bacterium]
PRASAIQAVSDESELQRVFLSLARIASLVVAPIAITFVIRGATFIGIWMGPEYAAPSGSILVVLALALVFMAPGQVMMSALIGMKAHMLLVPFQIAEAVLNVGLGIWWIQLWGLAGLAWANTLPTVAVGLVSIPWILKRALNLGAGRLALQVFIRPWMAMIPFAVGSWYVETMWQTSNLAIYFIQVALTLPLAGLGAWALALSPSEREAALRRARALTSSISLTGSR